ncbi:TPA: hypothetical protein ACRR3R_005137, partial [Klebsiella quasipneumoniae]
MAELNPPLGTTTPEIFLDNVKRADELVNGPAGTVNDRAGEPLDTWRQMMAKNDEVRQNLIPLSKQYMTLAAAQADVANIPEGSTTYVRSADGGSLADEYINNAGTLTATGRKMPSQYAVDMKAITSGNIFSSLSPRGAALNGGSVITDASNRIIGLFVPTGSTGASSYFCSDIPATALRGRSVKITQVYTVSDNWLVNASLNEPRAQYKVGSTITPLVVTDYSIIQNGNTAIQTGTVIVPNNADNVGLVIQYSSNAPAKSADLSVQLAQVNYVLPAVFGSVETQNDMMLSLRLAPVTAAAAAAQATA